MSLSDGCCTELHFKSSWLQRGFAATRLHVTHYEPELLCACAVANLPAHTLFFGPFLQTSGVGLFINTFYVRAPVSFMLMTYEHLPQVRPPLWNSSTRSNYSVVQKKWNWMLPNARLLCLQTDQVVLKICPCVTCTRTTESVCDSHRTVMEHQLTILKWNFEFLIRLSKSLLTEV